MLNLKRPTVSIKRIQVIEYLKENNLMTDTLEDNLLNTHQNHIDSLYNLCYRPDELNYTLDLVYLISNFQHFKYLSESASLNDLATVIAGAPELTSIEYALRMNGLATVPQIHKLKQTWNSNSTFYSYEELVIWLITNKIFSSDALSLIEMPISEEIKCDYLANSTFDYELLVALNEYFEIYGYSNIPSTADLKDAMSSLNFSPRTPLRYMFTLIATNLHPVLLNDYITMLRKPMGIITSEPTLIDNPVMHNIIRLLSVNNLLSEYTINLMSRLEPSEFNKLNSLLMMFPTDITQVISNCTSPDELVLAIGRYNG